MHHHGNLRIHNKSLLTLGDRNDNAYSCKQVSLLIHLPDCLFICLILIGSSIFVQLNMYIDVQHVSIHTQTVNNLPLHPSTL